MFCSVWTRLELRMFAVCWCPENRKSDAALLLLSVWFAAPPARASRPGLELLWGFLPSLLHLWLSLVAAAQGETGLSEGEWRAKPVLTQHLKPPHKYRLPFPISKQPIYLCLHASTLLHVMCWGVSLKMTLGHLAGLQRAGLWCAVLHFSSLQPLIHRATAIGSWPGVISFKSNPPFLLFLF